MTPGRSATAYHIGLATFGILALELALIRWTSTQVRIFAYFNNLVLICAFLGMGLGVALGRRYPGLVHWTLPVLFALSIPLAFSESLGLVEMPFPDRTVFLWGGDRLVGTLSQYFWTLAIFIFLISLIILVFLCAGAAVGELFGRIPTLRAYSADLLGSLLGIIAFTLITLFNASPPVWFLLSCAPFAWLSRKPASVLAFVAIVLLGWYSIRDAVYSPYNRIDLQQSQHRIRLSANRDGHQEMFDLSDEVLLDKTLSSEVRKKIREVRIAYDIPFQINSFRKSALVVGAGTGNDVQAALRNGYGQVHSVDIDPKILELGDTLHPEKPYDDPRVTPIANDARAFFQQYTGDPFDVVCYGLLDSHAMFSSMSTLRLENFVYSEEGIRAAWQHVSPHGHLSLSFSVFAGQWIIDRLYWTIANATGRKPTVIYHGMNYGAVFIVARDASSIDSNRLNYFRHLNVERDVNRVKTVTDDWPFLYLRPGTFPLAYTIILACVLLIACVATPLAFGPKTFTSAFDPALFFMGAGFLLIETRSVTALAVLFGSTWVVNSAVFTGILTTVLLGNFVVQRFRLKNPYPWFACLLLSTLFLWTFNNAILNEFPIVIRGLLGGLINAVPIAFAGVIVPIQLARSRNSTASLGSNLLGSVVGGCVEYLSMFLGLRGLALLALGFYLFALSFMVTGRRRNRLE